MNKTWSEINKQVQESFKKEETFKKGIDDLFSLRDALFQTILMWKNQMKCNDFFESPFINVDGYHNKTIAYSLWHLFRIEDIVANTLIKKDIQIYFKGQHQNRINSPIITTGNELVKDEITSFSKELNLDALYDYIKEVKNNTDEILKNLVYENLKIKMTSIWCAPPKCIQL